MYFSVAYNIITQLKNDLLRKSVFLFTLCTTGLPFPNSLELSLAGNTALDNGL